MQYVKDGDERIEVVIDHFGGLDRSSPLLGEASRELRNLRRMTDGSLQRREGAVPLLTMSSDIRGVTCVQRNDAHEVYVVAGDTVYYLEKQDVGYTAQALGTITTETGKVEFCCFESVLILMDGVEFWTLTPTAIELTEAYIPLYGKDWSESNVATNVMYEQPNLLSKRLRIRYCLTTETSSISARALLPASCDRLWINGAFVTSFGYSKTTGLISLGKKYPAGTIIEAFITMPEGYAAERSLVTCARRMASIGDADNARALLYDMVGEQQVWISHGTAREDRQRIREAFPNACMLYLLKNDLYTVGDGVHQVTGACRHYDRSLIFTTKETWMADGTENADRTLRLIPVNTTQGCSIPGAFGMLGNSPLTVCGRRILRWNSDTDERNECNALPISAPVEPLLDESFLNSAAIYTDALRGEAWFYLPGNGGRVLIWQAELASWTSFDGLAMDGILSLEDRIGFYHGATLYALDERATVDTDADGTQKGIDAEYSSSYLDFGQATKNKRVCHASVVAQCGDGSLALTLQSVGGAVTSVPLQGDGQELSAMRRRGYNGRFRFLRVGVRASHDGVLRLFCVRLTARH